jgi:pyruvate,water dikinase
MFSCNPITNDCSEIVIEASWGLGEAIVSGEVTPDEYIVDKNSLQIKNVIINEKRVQTIYDEELRQTVTKEVPEELRRERVLSDEEVITLASLAIRLEKHYGKPQDIEFAIDDTGIYIVQTRAITTVGKTVSPEKKEIKGKVLLKGIPASPGVGTGKARLVLGPEDFDKFQEGEVLVAKMTNPDFEPLMAKSSAIVTDEGGANCHAAIVSRELGKPCVVGTGEATRILKDGMIITVDGSHGVVYEGSIEIEEDKREVLESTRLTSFKPITATKIMLIATHSGVVKKYGHLVDGIGLLRLEFLIAQGGKHPVWFLNNKKLEEYTDFLVEKLREILSLMDPKPVIIRTLDMRTDEYRNLEGGENDPKEANPMLGWHGIRRSLDQPELFEAELQAYEQLIKDYGFKNVWIMFPFVVSWKEVKRAIKYVKRTGISPNKDAKIGVMVETPAAALTIEDIIRRTRIKFISFGTNDLTQLTLGVDRNNEIVQKIHSEKHPAVLKQIRRVIRIAKKHNVYTSICGQAGSDPEYAEKLVRYGIDSISVNPDAIELIRETVFRAEKKLILEGIRKKII